MSIRFGIQLAPLAARVDAVRGLARTAEAEGLDLLGVQDHPYAADHMDTFALLATILGETDRLRVFPDVASLPLRGPAMLGKAAASLDLLSAGRFELGIGAGAFWPAIASMGGPSRTFSEALQAMEEGVAIVRAMWRNPGERVHVDGSYYAAKGVRSGPAPAHDIAIWIGSQGPRALAATGRIGDGWAAPIPHYLPYDQWEGAQRIISDAAADAGRDPSTITRMAQLVGHITTGPVGVRLQGEEPIRTDAAGWADVLAGLAAETGFDTFVYWPESPDATQLLRWARDVVPATRALLSL